MEHEEVSSSSLIFFLIDYSYFTLYTCDFAYELHNYLKYLFSYSRTRFNLSQSKIMAFMVMSDYLSLLNSPSTPDAFSSKTVTVSTTFS